ncbi:MAG: AAA family ATPase, partial [Candidatus Rokubacteria bacterium]|nr:AAA family ATPase [Candidatus Rokubacteria bacterium]
MSVTLKLLGGCQATLRGRPIALSAKKTRALLAVVALRAPRPVPRTELCRLLWPDVEEEQARASLRQALAGIRRALPAKPEVLVIDARDVALRPGAVNVDATTFEALVAQATPAALMQATALYAGPLLDGLAIREAAFDEWLDAERERLRALALRAFERVLAQHGDAEAALPIALRLVALDPLRESGHRWLMRYYAERGQHGAALRQYETCAAALRRELRVLPEPETRRLYQGIVQRRDLDRDASAMPTRAPADDDAPLLGRGAELKRLHDALDTAAGGAGGVVAIIGEAGIGKSRCVGAMLAEARRRGVGVAVANAYDTEQGLPLRPWAELIRGLAARDDGAAFKGLDDSWRAQLRALVPERFVGAPDRDPTDRLRLFEAVVRAIQAAATGPLVIALEDLHWADPASVQLLSFVARRLAELPVLLVFTAREETLHEVPELARVLAALGRERRVGVITLPPLSREDTVALVHALVGGRAESSAAQLASRIWMMSRGHPFMAVEAVRSVEDQDGEDVDLPDQVTALIDARLARLGTAARHLTSVAAVIGRPFPFRLLQRAADIGDQQAAEAVEELARHRVLHGAGDDLDFTHDRIREVAYRGLIPALRARLHAAVGRAMETVYEARLDGAAAVAQHYTAAGAIADAVPYWYKAGQQAAARSAYVEAIAHLRRALDLLGSLPETAERDRQELALQLALGRPLLATRGHAAREVAEAYARARELSQRVGDAVQLVPAVLGLAQFYLVRAELRTRRELAEELLAFAERERSGAGLAVAHWLLANTSFHLGDPVAANEHARQRDLALQPQPEPASPLYPKDFAVYALCYEASIVWLLGYPERAARTIDRARRLAREQAHPFSEVIGLIHGALIHQYRREPEPCRESAERALAIARERDFTHYVLFATLLRGWALVTQGRVAEGTAALREGLAGMRETDADLRRPYFLTMMAEAHALGGDVDEGLASLDEAFAVSERTGERWWEAEQHRVRGELLLRYAVPDEAGATAGFLTALAVARRQQARSLELRAAMSLGRLRQAQGKLEEARGLVREVYGRMTEGFDTPDL